MFITDDSASLFYLFYPFLPFSTLGDGYVYVYGLRSLLETAVIVHCLGEGVAGALFHT